MAWAVYAPVKRADKCILMLLADSHNGHTGECFPAQQWIMDQSGYGKSTVQDSLKKMEEMGLLRRETERLGRGRGSQTSYILGCDILDPRIIDVQNKPLTPPENTTYTPDNRGSVDNRKEPERTGRSEQVKLISEELWKISPTENRKRTSKKQVTGAVQRLDKSDDLGEILNAWRSCLADPDTARENFKYVSGLHRWIRDRKFESWLPRKPRDPSLLPDVEAPEWDAALEQSFRIFAKNGDWLGHRYGHTWEPNSPKADYPAALYKMFKLERPC